MENKNNDGFDIGSLLPNEKISVVRKALLEAYNSIQGIEVKGQDNLKNMLKTMNTLVDIDSILEMTLTDILNLQNVSEEKENRKEE